MQNINWLLTCLLLLIAPSLCAQNVSLRGKVTKQKSSKPIIGANVYFKGTTLGVITNKDGEYLIRNIKPGNYEIIISRLGYHRLKQEITIANSEIISDFSLKTSNNTLGEVVVTGTGTPHHLKNAPVQTELINQNLIEKIAAANFTDVMLGISPSFDFSPGSMGPFMKLNGLSNDYTLILINGKRLYGDIGGQNDLNRINPSNIERIEVVKGASSALYGSEAIAGVINVITKQSKDKLNIVNNSRIGKFGEWVQHNRLDLNFGRFSSSTSFDRKTTDGWQLSKFKIDDDKDNNDPSDDVLVETDAMAQNASTDFTFNQKLSYDLMQHLNIYVQGAKYQRDVQRPQSVGKYGYLYDDFSYSAGAEYLLNKTDKITMDWHSDRFNYYYKYNQKSGDFVAGDKKKQTEQLRNAINLKGIFRLSAKHRLSAGGEYVSEKLESQGRLSDEKADVYTLAAYAQDEIEFFKDLSLVLGTRYVYHREFGSAFTPKISTLYTLNDFNFRGTYARGFKAPTLKELYYHYPNPKRGTLYLGNPELDPQTSNYYSISAEYIINGLSFSLTGYRNDVNDLIDYRKINTSEEDAANGITKTKLHYNIKEAETKGIDFIFNAEIVAGFSVGGGYSYVNAEDKTQNIRLEGVAQNYGNIRLEYAYDWKKYRLTTNLNARFQDEKFYDDGNAKAYDIWKLTTVHHFKTRKAFNFDLTAGIDNIFDDVDNSPYGSHYGSINPGRTYFMSLQITFNQ